MASLSVCQQIQEIQCSTIMKLHQLPTINILHFRVSEQVFDFILGPQVFRPIDHEYVPPVVQYLLVGNS